MDSGKDRARVLLAQSLKRLMSGGVPFEKITIKDITSGAGLNRPTFYRHFLDKYELLEWIFRYEVLEPSYALLDTRMIKEALVVVFKRIEMERPFYVQALKVEGQNAFSEIMVRSLIAWMERLMEVKGSDFSGAKAWLTRENVAWFYANSMSAMIAYWIRQGETLRAEDLLEAYRYFSTHTMEEALRGVR